MPLSKAKFDKTYVQRNIKPKGLLSIDRYKNPFEFRANYVHNYIYKINCSHVLHFNLIFVTYCHGQPNYMHKPYYVQIFEVHM